MNNLEIKLLSDISDEYDGVFSDIWGVVHNGLRANELAVNALIDYRKRGGKVILITNASRTKPYIQKMLDGMNISQESYDDIITSGDVTREIVKTYSNQTIHHIGTHRDNPVFDGLGITKGAAKDAKVVIVTGLNDDTETPDDYKEQLSEWLELKLPMICTNPDKIVEIGNAMVYCAGALADVYEHMGGEVIQAGKPFPPIYEAADKLYKNVADASAKNKKILAIGDSVRTDAKGAAENHLDFLFITGSIHAKEIADFGENAQKEIIKMVAPSGANLVAYQDELK